MTKAAPFPAKIGVIHLETGTRHERWPIDAREMVATGEYVLEAEYVPVVAAPDPEPEPVTPWYEGLEARTKAEIVALAAEHLGLTLDATQTKDALLAAVQAALAEANA